MMASRLRAGGGSGSGIVVPSSLYTGGADGYWASPSTISSQYRESTGQTAVSAAAQSVGLVLDKSRGLVRGVERAVNGSFSADTDWMKGAGVTIAGGRLEFAAVASTLGATQAGLASYTNSALYEVVVQVFALTAGQFRIKIRGGSFTLVPASVGTHTILVAAGALTTTDLEIIAAGVTTGSIETVSVREIPGNHLLQATSLSRPTLQTVGAYYGHLYDELDDDFSAVSGGGGTTGFLYCAAARPNSAGTSRTLWSDAGTNTGYRVRITSANVPQLSAGNGAAFTSVVSLDTLASGTTYVVTAWHDGTNLNVQVNNGATVSVPFTTATAGTAGFTEAKDNGAASAFFGGYLFDRVYVKNSTVTAAQREGIKRYVASYAGVTL